LGFGFIQRAIVVAVEITDKQSEPPIVTRLPGDILPVPQALFEHDEVQQSLEFRCIRTRRGSNTQDGQLHFIRMGVPILHRGAAEE
jgi:hypothetical protein